MSAMAANMRVATPVQIAVEREKPAEKDSSSGDDRFSNMLSQRQPRDDAAPAQHVAPAKPKTSESVKQKDDKPDDTLHLLQSSTAIQASVTPPAQKDSATPTQTSAAAVDDVLTKSAAKAESEHWISTAVSSDTQTANSAATTTTDQSAPSIPSDDASTQIAQLLQQTATPTQKPVVDTAAAKALATPAVQVPTDTKKMATQAAVPASRDMPETRDLEPTAMAATTDASPKTTEAPQTAQPSIVPLSTNSAPQADAPQLPQQTNVPQQPAATATQVDFSSTAPIITATVVAATTSPRTMLRDNAKDDSLDPIDATSPTGATPTFTLPEHRDIATVDGKVPVPAPSSPQFGDALGAKLSWMAERHIGHAEIRLSPDDLGTIDVRVRLNGEHVRAEFNSANADVRQAINNHLPRLRDMLSQQGFNLAEAHVGNGSNQQSGKNASDDSAPALAEDEIALPTPRIPAYTHNGILNTFA